MVAKIDDVTLRASLRLICHLLGTGWYQQRWAMTALVLVVLQLQLQKLLFYPMASVQTFGCILLRRACVWFSSLGRRPIWGLAFSALSLNTSSATVLVPQPCGLLLAVYSQFWRARQRARYVTPNRPG